MYKGAFSYLPADVCELYRHVRRRVHRRGRVQQSTTLCTLVTTEYLQYIRGCVYKSTIYNIPADVYKLYKHVRWTVLRRWRVHRRWRVQQSITLCTLVTTEYLKYIRGCMYNSRFYQVLSSSRRVQAVQTC